MSAQQREHQQSSHAKEERLRYVFLASSSFSGSTLLAFLLGSHPEITTVSEVAGTKREHVMDRYQCSCGDRMLDCDFWRRVEQQMYVHGYEDFELANFQLRFTAQHAAIERLYAFTAGTVAYNLLDRVVSKEKITRKNQAVARRTETFAKAVMEVGGGNTFLDATKRPIRLHYLAKYLDADLRVIHLVRDVRGNATSLLRHRKEATSVKQAAQRWKRQNQLVQQYLKLLPDEKQMLVTYEDICTNTEETLQRLFAFCGVDSSVTIRDYRAAPHHLLGNQMRVGSSSEIRLDERWKETLSTADLETIKRVTRSFSQRLYASKA